MIEIQKSRKLLVKKSFITLYEDEVILPNQKTSHRLVVAHPGASAVLALTPDNRFIFTQQYRYPIQQITLEIPAGKKDEGESFLTCAKRELEEETGYTSDELTWFGTFYPCVGYSDEILYLYLATNCYRVKNPLSQDEDECIEPILLTLDQIQQKLADFEFVDGKTIIALYHYLAKLR